MVHIDTGLLLSHKMELNSPFAETWIDLEIVIQSEVNQKEKQISRKVSYMWNLEKWYR